MNAPDRRQRRVLRWLLGLFLLAVLLLAASTPRWGVSPVPLTFATNAADFRTVLLRDWAPPQVEPKAITGFLHLRTNLFVDSLVLVPAYVGLLVFFTLACGPSAARHPSLRQWLCVPAVAAGLFDIAENSMASRALDDLLHTSLVDATVADVTLASRLKWALLGVALTVLAWRVLRAGPPRGRGLAATTCAFAALAFAAGAATKQAYVLHIGLVGMLLGIGGLVWQTSRTPASPPGGDRPPG